MSPRRSVSFITCAEYADGYFDDVLAVKPLADAGVDVTFAVWDDHTVDWSTFDLNVMRSAWDYPPRREEFLDWAASVPNLVNPVEALRWSSDKHYLADLAARGVPTVTSYFVDPGEPESGLKLALDEFVDHDVPFVIKPAIGAGSLDAGKYAPGDDRGREHAEALVAAGRSVLLQPYLDSVDSQGETALVYLSGQFCHAIRKEPMLSGPAAAIEGLFGDERTSPIDASKEHRRVAEAALAAAPIQPGELLYARVDLLAGPGAGPVVLELELVEPSLFMDGSAGAPERFAAAIAAHLDNRDSARPSPAVP